MDTTRSEMSKTFKSHQLIHSMPDQRRHRGPHPEDTRLFATNQVSALQAATVDLRWLLDRHYALQSSLKLVGDRYTLTTRQRTAVSRCVCTTDQQQRRWKNRLHDIGGTSEIWIDGYNVLTSIEAALSGGVMLCGHDGCLRDMASMHGSYRKVEETVPALQLVGHHLTASGVGRVHWLLDEPVSNSGRLRSMMLELGKAEQWPWEVELVPDPDPILAVCPHVIATADSEILNQARSWYPLVNQLVQDAIPTAWIVDLSTSSVAVDSDQI